MIIAKFIKLLSFRQTYLLLIFLRIDELLNLFLHLFK